MKTRRQDEPLPDQETLHRAKLAMKLYADLITEVCPDFPTNPDAAGSLTVRQVATACAIVFGMADPDSYTNPLGALEAKLAKSFTGELLAEFAEALEAGRVTLETSLGDAIDREKERVAKLAKAGGDA